jgi:hypothetical protein
MSLLPWNDIGSFVCVLFRITQEERFEMRTMNKLACVGLFGMAILAGCGGPDPAANPKFNKETLENPSSVNIPEIPGSGPGKGSPK